jgi:RNA polymerase sigma-70 factor (ECF subfamily)
VSPTPTADPRPDADVIARVLEGHRDDFGVLIARHQLSLYRIAYSMVRDSDVAADLIQDAFIRAYVNLARCRNRDGFRSWLVTLLRNRTLDHLKEKRRRDLSLSEEGVLRRVEARPAEPRPADRPDSGDPQALGSVMGEALARLSAPLREAFVLHHVEQLPVAEVARILGTGVSAVKMRLQRARQQLQEMISPELEAGDRK